MRSTVNIMTTRRSDEGRIRFRFVVDQSCFSSLHCPESSLFPRPTQTSVESVRGSFRKCMGLIPKVYGAHSERVRGLFGKGTGLIRKGYGAHSERVRGLFGKCTGLIRKGYGTYSERVRGSFGKGTGLIPKGKCKGVMQLIIYHSSEKRSGMRDVSTHLPRCFLSSLIK